MKYKITVSEEQAQVINKALEFYSRMAMGQFSEILSEFPWQEGDADVP